MSFINLLQNQLFHQFIPQDGNWQEKWQWGISNGEMVEEFIIEQAYTVYILTYPLRTKPPSDVLQQLCGNFT